MKLYLNTWCGRAGKEQCSSGENNSNEESKTGAVAIQIMLAMDTYLAYRK